MAISQDDSTKQLKSRLHTLAGTPKCVYTEQKSSPYTAKFGRVVQKRLDLGWDWEYPEAQIRVSDTKMMLASNSTASKSANNHQLRVYDPCQFYATYLLATFRICLLVV